MIPILFENGTTQFNSNGIGRLPDCSICQVTEERNGVYECMFTYPITGARYKDIQEGRIIYCTHDETGDAQPFDIYARTEPIDGVVTFYAHHISYRLGRVILRPMTASSCAGALAAIPNNTYNACPFTFWTDKNVAANFNNTIPKPVKEALGGSQGSILDVYGKGEYEWDKFEVRLYLNRGTDTGTTIRYGVNLTDYSRDLNYWQAYNACVPYWANPESGAVVTPGIVYAQGYDETNAEPVTMDLSAEYDTAPTAQQLADKAATRMANNQSWLPTDNITVSFVPLWQTEEYADVAPLQRVRLCDKVNVIYGPSGVLIRSVQVIKVVYDVLLDRYDSMELGTARASFEQMIKADVTEGVLQVVPTKSYLQSAIDYATELIKGGMGGHVIIGTDESGHPNEILIMDTDDRATAVNVWRWNMGGLGHSSNGYNGPYSDVAITMDGKINANMITTGTLNANIIKAGVLTDNAGNNSWDLTSGNLTMKSGSINIGNGNFVVTNAGAMSCKGASINQGTIETVDANNSKTLILEDGQIIGRYGQVIDMRAGIVAPKAIYMEATELVLHINTLYVSRGVNYNLNQASNVVLYLRDENPSTGARIIKCEFVNGILTDAVYQS